MNPGDTTTLLWSVTGATTITIDNGIGAVAGNSVQTVPTQTTTYTLTATNVFGTATATTTVTVHIMVSISPTSPVDLGANATQQFSATVAGSADQTVAWSIQEGGAGGTISDAGLYQAPLVSGSFHVAAVSAADATSSAVVSVNVTRPPPGTLDATFGDGGWLVLPINAPLPQDMLMVDGGEIFILLDGALPDGGSGDVLFGLTADGKPDPNVTIEYGPVDGRQLLNLGNRILVSAPGSGLIEARTSDGHIDTTFADAGFARPPCAFSSLAISPFGEIVGNIIGDGGVLALCSLDALGNYLGPNPVPASFLPVNTLEGVGPLPGSSASQNHVAALGAGQNGNFVIASGPAYGAALTDADSGFPTSGANGAINHLRRAVIDSQDRVVIAGFAQKLLSGTVIVARLTSTGAPDLTFGQNGLVQTSLGTVTTTGPGLDVQADGRVILAGASSNGPSVARLLDTGALDSSFGSGGIAGTSGLSGAFTAATLDSAGRILALYGGTTTAVVVRFWP